MSRTSKQKKAVPLSHYGTFSKDGTEFIIKRPDTPRPWINYLTNEQYCAIISQCAGGYSFYKDCRSDRILRWAPENWHFDRPGRYLYIKEGKKVWSATYQPTREKLSKYEARHGLGYTTISTTCRNIRSEATYFVPVEDTCEVWLFTLTNDAKKTRTLELYPYMEWLLGDYHLEVTFRNILNLYNRVWYDRKRKTILAKKTAAWGDLSIKPFPYEAFFASSLPVKGVGTLKDAFLGRTNTEATPGMLLNDNFQSIESNSGEDGIGVFKHAVTLKAGESVTFTAVLGQTTPKDVDRLVQRYRKVSEAKKELKRVQALWKERILNNTWVKTPDQAFDQMMNIWVKYQLYICNFWSRSPSYYHEGGGGRGYRDSCQDAEGLLAINAAHAKQKILKIATLIRKDGTSAPGWSDTRGPADHRPNKDHPVWLSSTVAAYIKETGDKAILKKQLPYLKDKWIKGWDIDLTYKEGAQEDGSGTLFEHLWRNLDFTFNDVGPKGFPLIGHADWNDAIDAAGIKLKGESVWLAQALVRSLKILAELAELLNESAKTTELRRRAQVMSDRVNKQGWDGEWYTRGYTDYGTIYGSKQNKEGKIYLNAQSWALLADLVPQDRKPLVLKSVEKYLEGPHGLALFDPAYSTWDPELGRISMFSEGTKENAAVFCHAATFMAVSELMHGYGNLGYRHLKQIMPNAQKDYDTYKTEPYCYAEYIVGPDNPRNYGEGAFTWITGTAGWNFLAGTEWVMGIQRDYAGLRVRPCLPKYWKRCHMVRPFRGATYTIEIHNPHGLQQGVPEISVDGKAIPGDLIRPHGDGKTHRVTVVLKPAVSAQAQRSKAAAAMVV